MTASWWEGRVHATRLAAAGLGVLLVLVVATVPASAGPLTIFGVGAGNVTETSARITWTTDEPATSLVTYGDAIPPTSQAGDLTLVTTHSVVLNELDLATTYYYEVQSTSAAGNVTVTDDNGGLYFTFTTVDVTPPVISGVQAVPTSDTSAVVTWITDEPADSVVNYGNSTALGLTASDSALVTSHSVPLSGLATGTTYYFEVQSTDALGNAAVDNNGGAFHTLRIYRLTGWGWSTDYTEIASADFVFNARETSRAGTLGVSDLRILGNVTVTLSDSTTETVDLEIYGTKARSLFYGGQDEKQKSASLLAVWISGDGPDYVSCWLRVTLPQGDVFETAQVYFFKLYNSGVEVPQREAGSFVEDLEYAIAVFVEAVDSFTEWLMSTNFPDIIGGILGKIMVLLAAARELGVPYIP